MAKATSPAQLILMLLLVSFLAKHAIAFRPNYCITQLALVSQACSVLTNGNEGLVQSQEDYNGEGDDDSDDDDGEDEERKHRHKEHGHGHENHGHGHDRKHKHNNRHEHRDGHKDEHDKDDHPRVNRQCCRWLKGLDDACVCEALLRLPPFLTKPRHHYTISVGSTCKMTFKCPGVF